MQVLPSNKIVREIFFIYVANGLNLLSGILTGFFIPKYIGVYQYGYYMVFTFYAVYVGFFHFGFNDGVYVAYGNYDYDRLPKEKFRTYFWFLLFVQLIIAGFLMTVIRSTVPNPVNYRIYLLIVMNQVLLNMISFFSYIYQITRRLKTYSLFLIVSKLVFIISLFSLFYFHVTNHLYFIGQITIINLLLLGMYLVLSRDLVMGNRLSLRELSGEIKRLISGGFLIMSGNFMALLVLGVGRFFIERFFSIRSFSMYSFAISFLAIFFILFDAFSTVLYPYLARHPRENQIICYERVRSGFLIISGLFMATFFVVSVVVNRYLPAYTPALGLLMVIYPVMLFKGQISIICTNYYKVMRYQGDFTINGIVGFILTLIFTAGAYWLYRSPFAIACATTIAFYLWTFYSDWYFQRKIRIRFVKDHIFQMALTMTFLFCGFRFPWQYGLCIYLLIYMTLITTFYSKELNGLIKDRFQFLMVLDE